MSKNYYGSICLTDIIAQAKELNPSFVKAANGKVYININVWINDDMDKYGNSASIKISDKNDIKGIYIGNLKEGKSSSEISQKDSEEIIGELEDLPF